MKATIAIFFIIIVLIQAIQVDKTNPKTETSKEINTNSEIMAIFKKACYDCHSNKTVWPWYSNIAPFSWSIASHVEDGRKALNFSTWNDYSEEEKGKLLKKIHRTAYAAMPLASYITFHEEADLTKDERNLIRDWTGVRK